MYAFFHCNASHTHTHTDEEHIDIVASALQNVSHQYKGIGRALRIPYSQVEQIHKQHKTEFTDGIVAIVAEYIRNCKHRPATMWKIVAAVSHPMGGNNHLQAKKIAAQFPRKLILYYTGEL